MELSQETLHINSVLGIAKENNFNLANQDFIRIVEIIYHAKQSEGGIKDLYSSMGKIMELQAMGTHKETAGEPFGNSE